MALSPTEQFREIRVILNEVEKRLSVLEERANRLTRDVERLVDKIEAYQDRVTRLDERLSANEKQAEKWSGRVWQIVLVVWTTIMGILSALTLASIGLKK